MNKTPRIISLPEKCGKKLELQMIHLKQSGKNAMAIFGKGAIVGICERLDK
jgi:hypothetical protein